MPKVVKKNNLNNTWKFLSVIVLLYLLLLPFSPSLFFQALRGTGVLIIKVLPSLFGAYVFIFLFNYFFSDEKLKTYFLHASNWKKYLAAVFLGILSSGPIYVWYNFLADLRKQGFKDGVLAVFLYNRAIKLPLLPVLMYYFSVEFVILLSVLMILFSLLNGLLLQALIRD